MSILCTICARGGSKGLKNKALKKIFNKPLISYTIKQAIKSKTFDEIVLSTDSKKIQRAGKKYGVRSWFLRPKKLSNDNCSKLLAIRHAFTEAEKYFGKKFNYCVDLDVGFQRVSCCQKLDLFCSEFGETYFKMCSYGLYRPFRFSITIWS